MANKTKSSVTSSQKRFWACNRTRYRMDIQFTEEQELLRSSIQRLLRDRYDFEARRKIVATDEGWSRAHWKAFAELGLCAAPFKESAGGLGGGPLTTMIIMKEFGRHLVVEPFFETVVLAGGLIENIGSQGQRDHFLPDIMTGESIWALAWAEGRSRYDFNSIATTARRQGENYVLSGTKAAVIGAPWADKLIVSARTSGGPRDRGGISLFVVDRHSANLHLQGFKTIDGRRAARIETGVRSQDQGRLRCAIHCRAGHPASRRHGHERRVERRPLLQADLRHQCPVRRSHLSPDAIRATGRIQCRFRCGSQDRVQPEVKHD